MKKILIPIFFGLLSLCQLQAQTIIESNGGTASLEDVILLLENDYGLLFSYKEALVQGVEVTLPSEELPLILTVYFTKK